MTGKPVSLIPTNFGLMFDLPVPEGHNMVIVCGDTGTGYRLLRLSLRHQVYRETLQRLKEQNPDVTGFTIMPLSSEDYIPIPLSVLVDK